jgi:hypothetical protein
VSATTEELLAWAYELAGLDEPVADSAVYVPGQGIRKVLFALDIGPAELLLAKELGVDACIAHHPQPYLLEFDRVFDHHVRQMVEVGVPEDEAEAAIVGMRRRWRAQAHRSDYLHNVRVAEVLGLPFLNVHLPLDIHGRKRMQAAVADVRPDEPVARVVEALSALPEVRRAHTRVEVLAGSPSAPAGRVVISHGAGTNGGYPVARAYFRHGVGTVVTIHLDLGEADRIQSESLGNAVVVGHLAGDLLGIEPYLALLAERGIEVVRLL